MPIKNNQSIYNLNDHNVFFDIPMYFPIYYSLRFSAKKIGVTSMSLSKRCKKGTINHIKVNDRPFISINTVHREMWRKKGIDIADLYYIEGGYLFGADIKYQKSLDRKSISKDLQEEFKNHCYPISNNIYVYIKEKGKEWLIEDKEKLRQYRILKVQERLNIYEGYNAVSVQSWDFDIILEALRANDCGRFRRVKGFFDNPKNKVTAKTRKVLDLRPKEILDSTTFLVIANLGKNVGKPKVDRDIKIYKRANVKLRDRELQDQLLFATSELSSEKDFQKIKADFLKDENLAYDQYFSGLKYDWYYHRFLCTYI